MITLGPFVLTVDRAKAVDFSSPVLHSYYTIVVPLQHKSKMWYFATPFAYHVWLFIIISIPTYIAIMGLAEYMYTGLADWDKICGFVLRNAFSEQNSISIINHIQVYQKILITVWLWSVLVLVQAYAGSLTAILAKPIFQEPINSLDELLIQNEVPWVMEKGVWVEYLASTAVSGSAMKQLYDRATFMSPLSPQERGMYGCYTAKIKQERKKFASLCDKGSIMAMISQDFSKTGKCNFYRTEDKLFTSMASHIATQVENSVAHFVNKK